MSNVVSAGQRMECGRCDKRLEFRATITDSALPVVISCPECGWSYRLDEDTARAFRIPKHDPTTTPDGVWRVDFTGETQTDDVHQKVKRSIQDDSELPPELRGISGKDMLNEIGSLMLLVMRGTHKLISNLEEVSKNFSTEIEEQLGMLTNTQESIEPRLVMQFLQTPFMKLPLLVADEPASIYGCFLITPIFYTKLHGIPLGNACGGGIQLLCPYSHIGRPLPLWLQTYLDIPPVVSLKPLKTRIVGQSLPYVWEQIPGTEPTSDHTAASPSIQMTGDTIAARAWLAQHGCPGWRYLDDQDGHMPVKQDWASARREEWTSGYNKLARFGRLLFATPEREDRLLFAQYALQCFIGKSAIICDREKNSHEIDGSISQSTEWIDWRVALGHDLNRYKVLAVEADADYFPQLLPLLYRYNYRLLLLTSDPIFDLLATNSWAPVVYGLTNTTFYWVRNFTKPYAWRSKYKDLSERLVQAFTEVGFVK